MSRFASLLLSFALASSESLVAADRRLAAEGDCVARTKTGDKPLSHWQLWHLSNGEYEVIDTSAKNTSSVQIFRFDTQFFPIGYTKKFGADFCCPRFRISGDFRSDFSRPYNFLSVRDRRTELQ